MELKPGVRLRSATDTTEVIVVRAPGEPVDLRCGGHPMAPADDNLSTDLASLKDIRPRGAVETHA